MTIGEDWDGDGKLASPGFLQVLPHVLPVSAWVSSRCSDMFSPCQRGFPPGAPTCSPRVSVGFLQVLPHVLPVSAWVSSRCSDMFSLCQRGFPPGALTCSPCVSVGFLQVL
ncbi:uncharacterized protein LOC125896709 isoform X3 [Epinephelus fuscoguttatus]|uniref:uncharacterized protein LOC125896709 isoform X3 n=1 Tax=Epinephelus fuscoguttatus TaxID=293821 RepID=UPI0020D02771|nr:uncharacterized protein LOC125896709 isoform X3 [Epinephelus fuscoguttatus]